MTQTREHPEHGGPAHATEWPESYELPAPEDMMVFLANMRQMSFARMLEAAGFVGNVPQKVEQLEQSIAGLQSAVDMHVAELQRQIDEVRSRLPPA